MDIRSNAPDTAPQAGDGERPLEAYPLLPADRGLWLRRGEGLGRFARRAVMSIAAWRATASRWRRRMADEVSTTPPGEPG